MASRIQGGRRNSKSTPFTQAMGSKIEKLARLRDVLLRGGYPVTRVNLKTALKS